MFGLGTQTKPDSRLPVQLHVLESSEALTLAKRLWDENSPVRHIELNSNKEFLRFSYSKPDCTVWMQQDKGRADMLELILMWRDRASTAEVYVLLPQRGTVKVGDDTRAIATLQAMLRTPSIVPVK